jgi:hypothetical protein
MEKFYTPEINEFHVGFEFEVSVEDTGFHKRTWDEKSEGQHLMLESGNTRVKYLDQEDIENLGFEKVENARKGWTIYTSDTHNIRIRNGEERFLRIFLSDGGLFGEARFRGTIKNKSELKTVLKMVGYEH